MVSGHIRSQPYGKDRQLHKFIYIEEHESKYWVNNGIKKVIITE